MRSGSISLLRIGGIDVRVHVSWLIIFALITWSLADQYYPQLVPNLSEGGSLVLGALSAILLFVSVLVHELAHSLVARARGLGAHSITLFIFGGVSTLTADAPQPSTEFVVAIVGPLTSFMLAGTSLLVAIAADDRLLEALFGYLAVVNGLLGVFNLIPGFPLDGGRVLRAVVWSVTRDARRGLEVAVAAGQVVGYGFLFWGVILVLDGDVLGGIWIAAIGWFLQSSGAANLATVRMETTLHDVRVRDVLRLDPTAVAPDSNIASLIEDYLLPGNRRAMPVVADDRLVGVVSLSDVQSVPQSERAGRTVASVMSGQDRLVTVAPDTPLVDALRAMASGDFEQVPVVEDGRLVGMVTRADVLRQIQLRSALHPR